MHRPANVDRLDKLTVVIEAVQKLAAIQSVSSLVTIHSDIGGDMADVETIEADAKPHVHLMPAGEGLKLSMLTRPFVNGAYYPPGTGRKTDLFQGIDCVHMMMFHFIFVTLKVVN